MLLRCCFKAFVLPGKKLSIFDEYEMAMLLSFIWGLIIFHFSAGVGRTGTLIVIDAMLNQIREENIIDVYKYVSMIRRQRNFMVQTEVLRIFFLRFVIILS